MVQCSKSAKLCFAEREALWLKATFEVIIPYPQLCCATTKAIFRF
ncbi:MAG: hypothetical protein RR424_03985 [Oscillospiraceae bacterium]